MKMMASIDDQINIRTAKWEENKEKFVITEASEYVLQNVRSNSCVTVTGSSGSGKTAIVHHVALTLQQEGYRIIPIDEHTELKKYYQPGIQTVFVIDNMCGNFTVQQQIIENWKTMLDTINLITEDESCKIIISCRLQIYKDPSFDNLKPFKMCECNIISNALCLSQTERQKIAQSYLGSHATEIEEFLMLYDFFPLLCYLYDVNKHHDIKNFFKYPFDVFKDELDKLNKHENKGKYKICALALCVMFNNKIKEEYFTGKDLHVKNVKKETLEALGLNKGTPWKKLKESLDILDGTFICRQEGLYRTRHDKVFDFLTRYFGEKILPCIIQYCDSDVIRERFEWKTCDKKCKTDFKVKLPDDCLESYIDRLISEWSNGNVQCVFKNTNFKSPAFRKKLLCRVSNLDRSMQEKFINIIHNVNLTALNVVHNFDFIQWLLVREADFGVTRKDFVALPDVEDVCELSEYNNVDPNLRNKNGVSPLYIACYNGNLESVCRLLKCKNVDPYLRTIFGWTPLWTSCYNGHMEVVYKLLEYNDVDLNIIDDCGRSPLYIACQEGHLGVVCTLLGWYNINPNLCDNDGASPLYIASQNGHLVVVCELLEFYDVDPNLCHKDGSSPLYIACQKNNLDIVCKLLECPYVDPNLCHKNGWSPLYIACQKNNLDIVCKLLECPYVDPNLGFTNGVSPLYIACENGYLKVICKLLECKTVDANLCNKDGRSPLNKACQKGNLEVICKLLECNKVDPNLCDKEDCSPLYTACYYGHLDVVGKLLECNNVNHNLCDKSGRSPLYIASQYGRLEVVTKLLEFKADSGKYTNSGRLPVDIATEKGYTDIVSVLKQASLANKSTSKKRTYK